MSCNCQHASSSVVYTRTTSDELHFETGTHRHTTCKVPTLERLSASCPKRAANGECASLGCRKEGDVAIADEKVSEAIEKAHGHNRLFLLYPNLRMLRAGSLPPTVEYFSAGPASAAFLQDQACEPLPEMLAGMPGFLKLQLPGPVERVCRGWSRRVKTAQFVQGEHAMLAEAASAVC
ncbi:hypothetical protein VTK56DRAFT_1494 [Thermocarpiscus australiensis]